MTIKLYGAWHPLLMSTLEGSAHTPSCNRTLNTAVISRAVCRNFVKGGANLGYFKKRGGGGVGSPPCPPKLHTCISVVLVDVSSFGTEITGLKQFDFLSAKGCVQV